MEKKCLFEVCANGVESCLAAQEGGADRVELCAGIPEGGTTPSYGEIKVARRLLTSTRLHVIIRPRGGDFLYTPLEVERMEEDIRICKQLGVDGVVIGCLNADGTLDILIPKIDEDDTETDVENNVLVATALGGLLCRNDEIKELIMKEIEAIYKFDEKDEEELTKVKETS